VIWIVDPGYFSTFYRLEIGLFIILSTEFQLRDHPCHSILWIKNAAILLEEALPVSLG